MLAAALDGRFVLTLAIDDVDHRELEGESSTRAATTECVAVSLDVDADLEQWQQLEQALEPCGHECWGNECGAQIRSGEDGLCEAWF